MSQSGKYIISAAPATAIETVTGNTGGAVSPDGSLNINLVGSGAVTVTGIENLEAKLNIKEK